MPEATDKSVKIDKRTRANCSCHSWITELLGIPKARSNLINVSRSCKTRCNRKTRNNSRLIKAEGLVTQFGTQVSAQNVAGVIPNSSGKITTTTSKANCGLKMCRPVSLLLENHRPKNSTAKMMPMVFSAIRIVLM